MTQVLDLPQTVRRDDAILELPAAHVRAGRRFEPIQEAALDAPMRDLAARLPGASGGLVLIPEFAGPNGVADLIAVTRAGDGIAARLGLGLPFLTSLASATIVAAVSATQKTTATTVADRLQLSLPQTRARLAQLTSIGAIRRLHDGYVREAALQPVGRMYALEAKVSDWRGAISQATRYSGWADAAAVVLLTPPSRLEDVIRYATNMSVGLAVGSTWILRPRIRRVRSLSAQGARLLASERFVGSTVSAAS